MADLLRTALLIDVWSGSRVPCSLLNIVHFTRSPRVLGPSSALQPFAGRLSAARLT